MNSKRVFNVNSVNSILLLLLLFIHLIWRKNDTSMRFTCNIKKIKIKLIILGGSTCKKTTTHYTSHNNFSSFSRSEVNWKGAP